MPRFVGRRAEQQKFRAWLRQPGPGTRVVSVTGSGGMGKTTLLMRFFHLARREGHEVVWLDGRDMLPTPEGFLRRLTPAYRQWEQLSASGVKRIILVDNYESIFPLDSWLRHQWLASCPAEDVLIIFASRKFLLDAWRWDAVWQARVVNWELPPFSAGEVRAYFAMRRIHGDAQALTIPAHQGIPLALALVSDVWHAYKHRPGHVDHLMSQGLGGRLFQEVDEELADVLAALALTPRAQRDILQFISNRSLSRDTYHRLAGLSFVRRTARGLTLHDAIRPYVLRALQTRDAERYRQTEQRVLAWLVGQWQSADRDQVAQDLLNLVSARLAPMNHYANLAVTTPDLSIGSMTRGEREAVVGMVEDWVRQPLPVTHGSPTQLLDQLLQHFPESLQTVRGDRPYPLAILGVVEWTRRTIDVLYPFSPEFLRTVSQVVPPAQRADSLLMVLVGFDHSDVRYPQPVIMGYLVRQFLATANGRRLMGLSTDPAFKPLLRRLGFQAIPLDAVYHDGTEELFILDLRQSNIVEWATDVLGYTPAPAAGGLDASLVREVLDHLWDMSLLRETAWCRLTGLTPEEFQRWLLAQLEQFRQFRPEVAVWIDEAYVDPRFEVDARARARHISRATYYRRLNQAVDTFVRFLAPRPWPTTPS